MTKNLKCIIVDDEPLARKGLEEYVSDVDFLELAAECENPLQASAAINSQKIDVMFLDIQMPRLNGIQFLKTLKNPPITIITTAYQEYAIQGFELDVIDYLLKPIPFDRFLKSAHKAKEFYELKYGSELQPQEEREFFFVKSDRMYEKIFFKDILYIQALQNYVEIHLESRKYITHLTLKSIYSSLPKNKFIKVHKSFIVSSGKVDSISGNSVKIGTEQIPLGKNHKDQALSKILHKSMLN